MKKYILGVLLGVFGMRQPVPAVADAVTEWSENAGKAHMHRGPVGFFTVLATACCLLEAFAAPAAAKTIVVTTLDDIANPPFDADGVCGTGTIKDLPGADGLVSLREVVIAANHTSGEQTITFAPSLSGGTIVVNFDDLDADTNPDPLPALCGGHTRINGDLDGDDVPDITLEGAIFPIPAPAAVAAVAAAAGISVLSSHNTINGLHVQHFPFGIRVLAGDFTNPGTVTHTRVTNNILTESKIDGIFVATGNVPGSRIAHTTITQNAMSNNARNGIIVLTTLSLGGAGSDTQIAHTTITDNEVTENGAHGITMLSRGDHNDLSTAAIAHNTISDNAFFGMYIIGGYAGADDNTLDVRIKDNTVTANGRGIIVLAGQENSSHNHVVARIAENTLERNRVFGIEALAAAGAVDFPTGVSVNNVLDVSIERNTVKSQTGIGILLLGGFGSPNGRAGAVANNNQNNARVTHNVIEGSTDMGMVLVAGGGGLASANLLDVWVAHNTVCHNNINVISGRGGVDTTPDLGIGNVLEGRIFQNTVGAVDVADGTAGNTATVTEFHNDPCP